MSCNSINLASRLYGVYMSNPSTWSLSDQLEFALFSEIIARNQRSVYNRIEENTYNNIVYNISYTTNVSNNVTLTYNSVGQIGSSDGQNTGNPGQGNNASGGVGRNINVSV